MLQAALKQEGIDEIKIEFAKDELAAVESKLQELSEWADIVLSSGGISVGDYDYVGDALAAIGVEEIFYKIRQKPGKPLFFGRKDKKLFFALPGNPASSLVCFYEYVVLAIRKMCGRTDVNLKTFHLPSNNSYSFSGERDEFLKAFVENGKVTLLYGQESFSLRSFAIANAIVYLPSVQKNVAIDDLVGSLRELLLKKYPSMDGKKFKIAVNHQIANDHDTILFGSVVALLPPFAGG